jgi:peptidyl-prolyl cis-trans isomerase A (cyclophilin A)
MRPIIIILITTLLIGCSKSIFKSKWTNEKSPGNFVARFETSKGTFDVQVSREWSPMAVDRFYQLVKHHSLDHIIFYRVVPNFVAQFGISDTAEFKKWRQFIVPDEKVVSGNKKGSISFARAGKETRSDQLYFNLRDNLFLDTLNLYGVKGFPAFGDVIRGMEVVEALYSGYGDNTMKQLDTLYLNRSRFLSIFPKLDSINKVYLLETH